MLWAPRAGRHAAGWAVPDWPRATRRTWSSSRSTPGPSRGCWPTRVSWCCVARSAEGAGPAPLPRPPELSAQGERVHVRTVRAEDDGPYRRAVQASTARMSRWNPVNLDDLMHRLATQSADNRTFFVFANE